MKRRNYRRRIIDPIIDLYLSTFGAVCIDGPRGCGKTRTARHHSKSEFLVNDPTNNFNNRLVAELSPKWVLHGNKPRLMDEWEEAPGLWDAVRMTVDQSGKRGQFILTNSASIDRNKYIHSGIGRITRLRMRPMSLYESSFSSGAVSLEDICYGKASDVFTGKVKLETIADYILHGGWPFSIGMNQQQATLSVKEHVDTILTEDIYRADDIKRDRHKIELLLRSLARNESTTATDVSLKRDITKKDFEDVNIDTIKDYLKLLERLYLTENIPPYPTRLRSKLRVKKSEKRHFVDPSLPCAILSLTKGSLLGDLNCLTSLFKSLVYRDLLTYVETFSARLYHYQDHQNNEIDAVIKLTDESWCGFQIRLNASEIDEAAKSLTRINNSIIKRGEKRAKSLCVICGLSNAAYKRDDGVYVVPITALKN